MILWDTYCFLYQIHPMVWALTTGLVVSLLVEATLDISRIIKKIKENPDVPTEP